ncbi:MAG: amidohydrolase [Rhizobiaceae bacterium]|nr:amidohydrolase [Rhizobiaceae bacterium]
MAQQADLIIENARVLTMDGASPRAEALAIGGDRLLAVGTHEEVAELRSASTEIIDADGATVLPGFIESHMHIFAGSTQLDSLSLAGLAGFDAVAGAVRRRSEERPGERLLVAEQAQYGILGGEPLDRHTLDRILPAKPLALYAADHHTMWANTAALEAAGLLRGAVVPAGSEIVIGPDGLAGGELREFGAFERLVEMTACGGRDMLGLSTGRDPAVPPMDAERAADRDVLRKGLAYCASLGITSFHNMDGNRYQLELLDDIDRAEGLPVRARMCFRMLPGMPLSDFAEAVEQRRRWSSSRLTMDFVKMFMDGVVESTTAFMLANYSGRPGVSGEALFGQAEFDAICIEADRLGFQIAVHAIGDGAVRRTLDGYAAARRANGVRDSRHRVEHIEVLDVRDLPRFAELGVIASMQPTHAAGPVFPVQPYASLIGPERLRLSFAWQTIRETGARLAFASDWPVAPLDPLLGVRAAMTRTRAADDAPDQRQTLLDALAGFTADGAYAEFAEDTKGRLRAGLLADVVVLSGDVESMTPEAVDELKVACTICDGRVVYRARA